MKCRLEINMDNAAFVDNGRRGEIDRILNTATLQIRESGNQVIALIDINGNRVGTMFIEGGH